MKQFDSSFHGDCSDAKENVSAYNLTCVNTTREVWKFSVGSRDGINILGIIVFTIAFAIVLSSMGPNGLTIVKGVGVLNEVIMKLVAVIMW